MSVAREALHSLSPSDSRLCPNQQPNHLKKSALSMTETWVSGEGLPQARHINYSHSCLWNVKAATSGHHHHCYIVAKLVDANIYLSRCNESSWLSLLLHMKNDIFICVYHENIYFQAVTIWRCERTLTKVWGFAMSWIQIQIEILLSKMGKQKESAYLFFVHMDSNT